MITISTNTRDGLVRLLSRLITMCDRYAAWEGYDRAVNCRRKASLLMKELQAKESTEGRKNNTKSDIK